MALTGDIYRELEDILGPENISEDPLVLDAYAFAGQHSQPLRGASIKYRFFLRPEAVILPGSAQDVQAIIKFCNRRALKCKATSTGYGFMNAAGSENTILMDLRRMNRILDIDEKNMLVLVEPYVSFAQVQAEAMKRGLNTHIIGAGSQPSYLASMTSVVGNNSQSISQGFSGRNLLAVEWVLPSGEMVRLGASGSQAGWFTGDGPGPSLRGIMRGVTGACGGLGVFTKCAGHLHPWAGPKDFGVKGVAPYYESEVPPNFEYHILEWPTWEQCAQAVYKIGEAGIAYALHKTGGPGSHGACMTGNNNEYYEKRMAGEYAIPRVSWAIILAAYTSGEHLYQVKTLDTILEETGGRFCPVGEDATWKNRDYLTVLKACHIPRLAFRLTGNFSVDGLVGIETMDHVAMALKVDEGHRDKYAEMGVLMDDGTLNSWGVPYEGAHLALFEAGHQYNPVNDESCKGMGAMVEEGEKIALKVPFALNWTVMGEKLDVLGPYCGNPQHWMRKIKKVLDPNIVSDPSGYVSPE